MDKSVEKKRGLYFGNPMWEDSWRMSGRRWRVC